MLTKGDTRWHLTGLETATNVWSRDMRRNKFPRESNNKHSQQAYLQITRLKNIQKRFFISNNWVTNKIYPNIFTALTLIAVTFFSWSQIFLVNYNLFLYEIGRPTWCVNLIETRNYNCIVLLLSQDHIEVVVHTPNMKRKLMWTLNFRKKRKLMQN